MSTAPTIDLNDLEAGVANLSQLLSVIVGITMDLPRTEDNSFADQAASLSIIARDLSEDLTESIRTYHTAVLGRRTREAGL